MANQWLRLWHDMPNDPKWRTIAKAANQSIAEVIAVYIHLLVIASLATKRGSVQVVAEDLASALDMSVDAVQTILKHMQGKVLKKNRLMGWSKRQPIKEDGSAERARNWRKAKKLEKQTNANERQDKEKDTDKESEKDTDKERELHSLPKVIFDDSEVFMMFEGWQPDASIEDLLLRLGLSEQQLKIPPHVIAEFVCFWITRSETKKNQQQWQHALAKSYLYALQRGKHYAKASKTITDIRLTAFDTEW